MVRLQALALCKFVHHCAEPNALRYDLSFDLVRPMPMHPGYADVINSYLQRGIRLGSFRVHSEEIMA